MRRRIGTTAAALLAVIPLLYIVAIAAAYDNDNLKSLAPDQKIEVRYFLGSYSYDPQFVMQYFEADYEIIGGHPPYRLYEVVSSDRATESLTSTTIMPNPNRQIVTSRFDLPGAALVHIRVKVADSQGRWSRWFYFYSDPTWSIPLRTEWRKSNTDTEVMQELASLFGSGGLRFFI